MMKNSRYVCLRVALFGDFTKDNFNPNAIVIRLKELKHLLNVLPVSNRF